MKVAIFGAGSLGCAIAKHLLFSQTIEAEELCLINQTKELCNELKFQFPRAHVSLTADESFIPDILVLSVKPQDFITASQALSVWKEHDPLVISVMTGITIEKMTQYLAPAKRIVRTMPNLPFMFGEGATVFVPAPVITEQDIALVKLVFEGSGLLLEFKEEELLNVVTAVSGSGPGYLAMLYQKICAHVTEMGVDQESAELLIRQTIHGFLALLDQGLTAKEIEKLVTSKGGTTEAGKEVLKLKKVPGAFNEAINAAAARAKELSEGR